VSEQVVAGVVVSLFAIFSATAETTRASCSYGSVDGARCQNCNWLWRAVTTRTLHEAIVTQARAVKRRRVVNDMANDSGCGSGGKRHAAPCDSPSLANSADS
jgi:hypothetical protein